MPILSQFTLSIDRENLLFQGGEVVTFKANWISLALPVTNAVVNFVITKTDGAVIASATGRTNIWGNASAQVIIPISINIGAYAMAVGDNGEVSNKISIAIGNSDAPTVDLNKSALDEILDNFMDTAKDVPKDIHDLLQAVKWTIIAILVVAVIALAFYALQPSKQKQSAEALAELLDTAAAKEAVKAGKLAAMKGAA